MSTASFWWHAEAYRLMDLRPVVDARSAAELDTLERRSGLRLPAAVREWYSVAPAQRWLAHRRQNFLVAAEKLGEPTGGIDRLAHGRLVTETDCQYCCHWVVRLVPPPDDAEPLFPVPGLEPHFDEDPPVWVVDPDDPDRFERRYADSFSAYVLTSVWDSGLFGSEVSGFDLPLPPHALDLLRQRYTELPTTYAWAGNQDCDAVHRFDGAARIMLAVKGQVALYVVARTRHPRQEAELRSLFGL